MRRITSSSARWKLLRISGKNLLEVFRSTNLRSLVHIIYTRDQ